MTGNGIGKEAYLSKCIIKLNVPSDNGLNSEERTN